MNFNTLQRFTDPAKQAFYWAFLCSLREHKKAISTGNLLVGIQAANSSLLSSSDLQKMGFSPLDVTNLEAIQDEMQKLLLRSRLERAGQSEELQKGTGVSWWMPSDPSVKLAFDAAEKAADEYAAKSVATPHLLLGVLTDSAIAAKMAVAGWNAERAIEACRDYQDGIEPNSAAQELERYHPTPLPSYRCGIGYDLHRLEAGRKLIIGGIEVPFDKGPVGHSDGDVLAHALCDALLGAAGLGDIGTHFPDSDPKWKGANSLLFLEQARKLILEKRMGIEHVDAVVILERPKLGPHFPRMREALSKSLGVAPEKIHLKAKTNEGVDAVGRGEAIACHVAATLVAI